MYYKFKSYFFPNVTPDVVENFDDMVDFALYRIIGYKLHVFGDTPSGFVS